MGLISKSQTLVSNQYNELRLQVRRRAFEDKTRDANRGLF